MSGSVLLKQYQHADTNVQAITASIAIESLINELQKEQGLSVGYLSSNGKYFKQELQQQWQLTDDKIDKLANAPALANTLNNIKEDTALYNSLAEQMAQGSFARKNLITARQKIIQLDEPGHSRFYSQAINKLINFSSQLRFKSDNSYHVLMQSDLLNILKIQAFASSERNLINKVLSAPIFNHHDFHAVIQRSTQLKNAINNAHNVITKNNLSNFEALTNTPQQQKIANWRVQLSLQDSYAELTEIIKKLTTYRTALQSKTQSPLLTKNDINKATEYYVAAEALLSSINKNLISTEQQVLVNRLNQATKNYLGLIINNETKQQAYSLESLQQLDDKLHDNLDKLKQLSIINTKDWWFTSTASIDSLHHFSNQLANKIAQQNIIEKQRILSYFYISLFAGVLFFYLVYLVGKSTANNLINTISGIVKGVEKLAKDPDLELELPVQGSDEMTQISRAINKMVSERMKSKSALHRASAVFEHSAEGIMVTDADNNIELVNPAFTKITGYTLADVKGKKPNILSSAHHQPEFYQALWQSLKDKNSWEGEIWNKRKDGKIYPEYLKITAVKDNQNNIIQYIGLFLDISNNKQYEQDLWYKSNYDALTKLPNRHLFSSRLQQAINEAQHCNQQVAIFFIDLDRFKYINELHGHAAGNKVLKQTASRLENILAENDSIARFGGDEFIVISPVSHNGDSAESLAQKLSEVLSRPYKLEGKETSISSSFGIAFYPEDGQDIEMLLHNSETAMYQAKRDGRAHYQYYAPEMNLEMLARMHLEQRLRRAVKQGEFHLEYQPIVDMRTGTINSVEALIRWHDPEHGFISPEAFIPIAEETGLIEPLGEWILHQALTDLADIHAQGISLCMAINISARQCINTKGISFCQTLQEALKSYAISPKDVHIEITESLLIEDKPQRLQCLNTIKQLGVDIYLDDFGTGYSALSYLTKCPISVIKIDKSFIENITNKQSDVKLIRAIVMMAKNLELPIVAEGVETRQQWDFLQGLDCDYAQGYLISRPLTKAHLLPFLQQAMPFQYLADNNELKAVKQQI
ncbi:EAL domain-containing protein [Shewanella fidelis]|uniref:EAL domain-containing protein n=1 Tax=Shewanella fidelis TaxID=173509 RepID=UPI001FDFF72C|nr:EAL domain-containing protein [Shewanella fidelis]